MLCAVKTLAYRARCSRYSVTDMLGGCVEHTHCVTCDWKISAVGKPHSPNPWARHQATDWAHWERMHRNLYEWLFGQTQGAAGLIKHLSIDCVDRSHTHIISARMRSRARPRIARAACRSGMQLSPGSESRSHNEPQASSCTAGSDYPACHSHTPQPCLLPA